MLDGRHGAECPEHAVRILGGGLVMIIIENIDQQSSGKTSQHLCCDIRKDCIPCETAGYGKTESDGRIQMRTGVRTCDEDAAHDRKTPGQ